MTKVVLIQGNSNNIPLPDNTVTAIVTDCPYGIGFMGEHWDYDVPGVDIWRECLRVAKPGAQLIAFGGTRTIHRITCAIEDAGWEIRDTIYWIHGQGLPKSKDISQAIDKELGAERPIVGIAKGRGSNSGSGTYNWNNPNDKLDRRMYYKTAPATDESKKWNGWGSCLKPAVEPMVLAMKPTDGTFASNATKWGVAGLNIEGCKIKPKNGEKLIINKLENWSGFGQIKRPKYEQVSNTSGRWPSNVIIDESAESILGNEAKFYYCSKANKEERNAGLEGENPHKTVKPIDLMGYLCRLVKMPSDNVILDPFAGSGTTGIACIKENIDIFIGIDINNLYCDVAKKRILFHQETSQQRMF